MATRNGALRQLVGSTIVGSALAAGAQAANQAAIRVVEDPGNSVKLQIAVRTYQTPEATGPTVSLVGVAHIGERRFYRAIQEFLDGYAVVLYESVKPPGASAAGGESDAERAETTEAALGFVAEALQLHHRTADRYPPDLEGLIAFAGERDPRLGQWLAGAVTDAWGRHLKYRLTDEGRRFVLASLGADGVPGGEGADRDLQVTTDEVPTTWSGGGEDNLQAELAKALGLEFQLDAIDYGKDHFRSSDLAMDELVEALGDQGVDFGPIGDSLAGSSLPGKLVIYLLRVLRFVDLIMDGAIADTMKVVLIELLADETLMEQGLAQFGPGLKTVLIDKRNQLVIDQLKRIVQEEPEVKSVGIFYGAAHMPDMARRLTEQLGYEPAGSVRWLTAFEVDLRHSAMTASQLTQIRRMIRRQLESLAERGKE